MYSTCFHCNAKLGANEVIEIFPVGRRLAFDAAKGRLWVVCPNCHRWNLTPLEERWEAIEECERQFRDTRLRASTDNIGLAKVREGLELVRIGNPMRPEMAAWRYARELQQRWRRYGLPLTGAASVMFGLQILSNATLISTGFPFGYAAVVGFFLWKRAAIGGGARVAQADGRVVRVSLRQSIEANLVPDGDRGWAMRWSSDPDAEVATGAAAQRALRGVLTVANFAGAPQRRVVDSLKLLEQAGSPEAFLRRLARIAPAAGARDMRYYPREVKLALEMALHDETERLASEGELAVLEEDWRLAEEIAQVADGLMLPRGVLDRFSRMKAGESEPPE